MRNLIVQAISFNGLLITFGILMLLSCSREEVSYDVTPAKQFHKAYKVHYSALPVVRSLYYNSKGLGPNIGDTVCGTLEYVDGDTSQYPEHSTVTLKVDHGTGCRSLDGKMRKGALEVRFNRTFDSTSAIVTVTSLGYSYGGTEMIGSFDIHVEEKGHYVVEHKGSKALVDGKTITFTGEEKFTLTTGSGTDPIVSDDAYDLEFEVKGEGIGDKSYYARSLETIHWVQECSIPEKGKVELKPNDLAFRAIHYSGSGNCENTVEVAVNGRKKEVEL